MDYELELACVIGTTGCNFSEAGAASSIFGYTIFNDFSARDTQSIEMNGYLGPGKSKDFDNANAMGPFLVTADEFNPYDVEMKSRVNGEERSSGRSDTMYYSFEELIAFISRDETMHAGEILGSGTIGGGCGIEQMKMLNSGDVVELEIENIGVLRNRVVGN